MKRTDVLQDEVREDTMNRRTLRKAVAGVLKEASSIRNGVADSKRNSSGSQNGNNEQVERRIADGNRG